VSLGELAMTWGFLTRLGEAQILLPAVASALCWLGWRCGWPALRAGAVWLLLLAGAALLTLASKLAFIGWGLGWAWADFTGVSGHTLVATAVLPVLASLATSRQSVRGRLILLLLAVGLVVAVGVSRVVLGAHSLSEVLAGWLLGASVAVPAVRQLAGLNTRRHDWSLLLILGTWGLAAMMHAPATRSHEGVTALALALSGHAKPFVRADLHRPRAPGVSGG
jgi:membrane-associated phospholipid phosphatase